MTSEIALNATTDLSSSVSSFGSWFGVVAMVAFCTIFIMITIMILSSLERYKKFWKFIKWLRLSLGYFGWGTLSMIVISLPALLVYWEFSQANKGNIIPIKWTVVPIILYALVSIIGYLIKTYVIDRIIKFNKQIKKRKDDEPKDKS